MAKIFNIALGQDTNTLKGYVAFNDVDLSNFLTTSYNVKIKIKQNESNFVNQTTPPLKDVSSVLNGISNIFIFKIGERVLDPEFGNPVMPHLFEPINNVTAKNIANDVLKAIEKYEPRVLVNNINIKPDTDDNTYYLTIYFSIPAISNDEFVYDIDIPIESLN